MSDWDRLLAEAVERIHPGFNQPGSPPANGVRFAEGDPIVVRTATGDVQIGVVTRDFGSDAIVEIQGAPYPIGIDYAALEPPA